MNKLYFLIAFSLLSNLGFSQCFNCGSQFPTGTQSTTSNSLVTVSTSIWASEYSVYNVTAGETYTWTTCSSSYDTQLTLFSGVGCGGTVEAYNDDDCGLQSTITWTATFTGQVSILVTEYDCASNATSTTLEWACTSCGGGAPAPSNDDCSGATSLPCGTSGLAGTTTGASLTANGTGCTISDYGVWYSFTGDGNLTTITADPESGYDIEMAVASGSCGSLTNIDCVDGGFSGDPETSTFSTTLGLTYYIYIANYSSSSDPLDVGDFTISRSCTAPVSNDDCSDAVSLPCGTSGLAGTTAGTSAASAGTGCTISDYGVWYTFVGDGDQTTITADPEAGFDIELAVASGSCGSLTNVDCEDGGGSGTAESITFITTNGVDYYVYVAYWSSSGDASDVGNFTMSRTCTTVTPPPNDDCSGAIPAPVNTDGTCTLTASGTLEFASSSTQTNTCGGTANDDVWYSFTATSSAHSFELLNVSGSTTDLYHSVYGGSCGSIGAPIICSDPNTSSVTGLTVGQTYYVRIFSYSSVIGADTDFDLCIQEDTPPVATGQDCAGAQTVCSDDTFTGNSSGSGNITDLNSTNQGCLGSEHESSWYFFSPNQSGQVELTLNTTVDYDFAIWGPLTSASCPPAGSPIRCSYSSDNGPTGLASGSGDVTEGAGGDAFVDPLNVTAGEVYIMVIDNYTADGTSFDLDWTLSGGASLDCTVLDVELLTFTGETNDKNEVLLNWSTMTETKSDHFVIEKANARGEFEFFKMVKSKGGVNLRTNYSIIDENPYSGTSYYKLSEVSSEGEVFNHKTISVNIKSNDEFAIYPNPIASVMNIENYEYVGHDLQITILDAYGKTVKSLNIENWSGKYTVDCSGLNSGVYTVRFLSDDEQFGAQKIVVR